MARNYIKTFIVSGYQDDGSGGSVLYSRVFRNEGDFITDQMTYGPYTWLPGYPICHHDVYFAITKDILLTWIDTALRNTVVDPALIVPPRWYLVSPRDFLDEENPNDVGRS